MNFYFTFHQLSGTAERLEAGVKNLAANALRTSPREGQANRDLLELCGDMAQGVKELLNSKVRISRVQLRRAALLFQVLEMSHRRVLRLAGAGAMEENPDPALWELFHQARRDYQALRALVSERVGAPLFVELPDEEKDLGLPAALRQDSAVQDELVKLIEKGIEVFDEERELTDHLAEIRRGLMEERKGVKRLLASLSREGKGAAPEPRLDATPA